MKRLMERFRSARYYSDDCFVADYSEATHSRAGVVISEREFDDIDCFTLRGCRPKVTYVGVNLEEHPSFIRGIPNCECFFVSAEPCLRPWILFLELKYCKARNLGGHSTKAVTQMASVLRKLVSDNIINPADYRIYFNYSSPSNRKRQPFSNFLQTQSNALKLIRRSNACFFGFNELIIASGEFIRAPKRRI